MINVYTEEEAKEKVCCKGMEPRDADGTMWSCRASMCMAWRYVETLDPETLTQKKVAGYCGLGGKP